MTGVDSLSIGRLHARYVGVDEAAATELDEVLGEVVHSTLERVAREIFEVDGSAPWAVCIDAVDVALELDLARSRDALASDWARELVAALVRAVGSRGGLGHAIAVYRTEQEALLDLIIGVARRRDGRRWAWRQLGLIGTSPPTGIDVANALAARPALAPAVIAACPADAKRVIDPIGWIVIAGAVARASGAPWLWTPEAPSPPAPVRPTVDESRSSAPDDGSSAATGGDLPRRSMPLELVARIVAAIPVPAWSAADGEQLRMLAFLATMIVAPHAAHQPEFLAAVIGRAQLMRSRTEATTVPPAAPISVAETAPDRDREPQVDPSPVYASRYGGVWYLVRPIVELDVMVRLARHDPANAPDLLAAVIGRATGVDRADPAVVLLAGTDVTDDRPLGEVHDDDRAVVAALAAELTEQLRQRGDGRLGARDLAALWLRPAEMTVGVGTIDVTFDLDDVDIDARALGLDADPGFVWWSGSIVRFHYV